MPDVRVREDLSLSVVDEGPRDAPALLLITGLGGLKEGWFRQVPHFQQRFRTVAFDNRGLGGSTVLDRPTTVRDMAEDAVLLLDALGIGAAHVFGVSLGGKIAQELALGWPDRVDRLVLGCTSAGEAHRVDRDEASALRGANAMTADEILEKVVPALFGREYREKNPGAMRAFARSRERRPPDRRAIARQWEAYEGFDSWERLPELRHRTLVITGDEDTLTDPRNSVLLAERLPDAVLYQVAGAGHSFHIEKPDAVNAAVERFLLAERV